MRTDAREMLAVGILGRGSQLVNRIEALLRRGRMFTAGPSPAAVIASAMAHRDHEDARLDAGIFVDRTDLLQFIVHAYIHGGSCALKAAIGEDCPLIAGTLPEWVKTDRWEIEATLPAGSPVTYTARQLQTGDTRQLNQMLQVLLEDRFHLKVHRETREIPVYALAAARSGSKLKHTPEKGELLKTTDGRVLEHHGLNGLNTVPGPDGAARMRLNFQASSMGDTAAALGPFFDRPVVDQTGLTGEYDFAVDYEVDPDERGPALTPNVSGRGGNFVNPYTGVTSAALSAGLQAVGLRLESTKAPLEVLVIDRVEKPDAN
jgi:uncharacterized protein (TIGR03435 family)